MVADIISRIELQHDIVEQFDDLHYQDSLTSVVQYQYIKIGERDSEGLRPKSALQGGINSIEL